MLCLLILWLDRKKNLSKIFTDDGDNHRHYSKCLTKSFSEWDVYESTHTHTQEPFELILEIKMISMLSSLSLFYWSLLLLLLLDINAKTNKQTKKNQSHFVVVVDHLDDHDVWWWWWWWSISLSLCLMSFSFLFVVRHIQATKI